MSELFPAYPNVVALGGGHGLGRLLSSLQGLGDRLTGIVTTSDNGGSSGRLRQSEGCIAWGDLRNCINQLVTEPSTGSRLFEYRFSGDGELAGHNLGNLMLLALGNMTIRPLKAINLIRNMLGVSSQIIPMSEQPTDLLGMTASGASIFGETSIDAWQELPEQLQLVPPAPATPEAVQAIEQADLLLIGPGSFLTSLLPPLLVPEIADAIGQARARLIFIANLVQEQGPGGHLDLQAQLGWLSKLTGRSVDAVLMPCGVTAPLRSTTLYQNAELAEADCHWRHDRTRLLQSLAQLVTRLDKTTAGEHESSIRMLDEVCL